jgi:hypothetical protein
VHPFTSNLRDSVGPLEKGSFGQTFGNFIKDYLPINIYLANVWQQSIYELANWLICKFVNLPIGKFRESLYSR